MTRGAVAEKEDRPVVATQRQLDDLLGDRRALLLSATVPSEVENEERIEPWEGDAVAAVNGGFASGVQAARIRDAACAMTRTALNYGYRLICRAHPSITPMLLQAASDMDARPGSVVVFESLINPFGRTEPTLVLSNWSSGTLVVTDGAQGSPSGNRVNSLAFMREMMMRVKGLNAAVFIGGRHEVELDAAIFQAVHPLAKSYAIESTGSAAAKLARRTNRSFPFQGGLDASTLRDNRSYSVVAHRIMKDIVQGGRP